MRHVNNSSRALGHRHYRHRWALAIVGPIVLFLAVKALTVSQSVPSLVYTNNTQSLRTTKQSAIVNKTTSMAVVTAAPNTDWHDYRLGDWVLGTANPGPLKGKFRHTLAWEYAREGDVKNNSDGEILAPNVYVREIFCDLVKKRGVAKRRSDPDSSSWRPGDLVVHLRLGDTLDGMMMLEEAEEVFEHGVSIVPGQIRRMITKGHQLGWWHYVKSKCYFTHAITRLETATAAAAAVQPLPPEMEQQKRVFIIGSAIHNKKNSKNEVSAKYVKLVRRFFTDRGYEVNTRLDGTPDDDMVWMSQAPTFVAAGGGFSHLVTDCVRHLGGVAFNDAPCGTASEVKARGTGNDRSTCDPCWMVPRPNITMKEYSWEKDGWQGKERWTGIKSYPPEKIVWK